MTKIASTPALKKSTPVQSTNTGASKPAVKASPLKPGVTDGTKLSKEALSGSKASSGVGSLVTGLMSWGQSPGTDAAKGAHEIKAPNFDKPGSEEAKGPKPLELGEGEFLRRGAGGDKVKQLQELLNSKGAQLDADGKFGPNTLKALKKFQGENELGTDGVVGPKTLEKLNGASVDKGEAGQKVEEAKGPDQGKPVDQGQGADGAGRFADTRQALDKLPEPLKKYADVFQAAGEKYGVDPRFLAAISMHETGNGKSSAFRNKNNAMGISGKGGPKHISSVEKSIDMMAQGLAKKDGYYKGKTTIGGIGKVYAPIGAANDPTGLNGHWAKGVAKNFRNFGGDPTGQVLFR